MSLNGLRIGGGRHVGKRPPAWAMGLGLAAFTLVAICFAAGGWCVVFVRYVTSTRAAAR
jgi:hypothetical protein